MHAECTSSQRRVVWVVNAGRHRMDSILDTGSWFHTVQRRRTQRKKEDKVHQQTLAVVLGKESMPTPPECHHGNTKIP